MLLVTTAIMHGAMGGDAIDKGMLPPASRSVTATKPADPIVITKEMLREIDPSICWAFHLMCPSSDSAEQERAQADFKRPLSQEEILAYFTAQQKKLEEERRINTMLSGTVTLLQGTNKKLMEENASLKTELKALSEVPPYHSYG